LTPPIEVSALGASWMRLPLSEDQAKRKERAIHSHSTQLFLWKDYLLSFIRVNETFAEYPDLEMKKVHNDPDFFRDGAPKASFLDVHNDQQGGGLQPIEDLTSLGMAYDERHAYLVLQVVNGFDSSLVNHFQLRVWDGKGFKRLDLKIQHNKAAYEHKAHNSVIPWEEPQVKVQENMMVVTLPLEPIHGAEEIMLSADVYDQKDKFLIDFTSLRDIYFSEEWLDSSTAP